jgi:hypothetical protein
MVSAQLKELRTRAIYRRELTNHVRDGSTVNLIKRARARSTYSALGPSCGGPPSLGAIILVLRWYKGIGDRTFVCIFAVVCTRVPRSYKDYEAGNSIY